MEAIKRRKRLLLVTDDWDLVGRVAKQINGCNLVTATNIREAQEIFGRRSPFDCIAIATKLGEVSTIPFVSALSLRRRLKTIIINLKPTDPIATCAYLKSTGCFQAVSPYGLLDKLQQALR